MIVKIQPSVVKGSIQAPASKSAMQRACAAALIKKGRTVIHNPGVSNDDKAIVQVVQAMGATVEQTAAGDLIIDSNATQPVQEVNGGESGLGIRMFTPIIALRKEKITINGEGSLLNRPMDFFDEILPQLGVSITSTNGKLPLTVQGPLQPKNITIDGSLSSQFLTGLLMAYSAVNASDVTIYVKDLKSKPYIDLTLKVMKDFGLKLPENNNYKSFYYAVNGEVQQPTSPTSYTIEADWSSAAMLLVAAAITGNIHLKGTAIDSTQADKAILQALSDAGCFLSVYPDAIEIQTNRLKAFHFDATDCPDLFPPLVALAAYCEGTTVIKGAQRLLHKESNRAHTLQQEFKKMGIQIDLQDDLMIIHGGTGLKGAIIHSRHDHRIAMACTIAALRADGETTIEMAEAINKSYPGFYDDMKQLGVLLHKFDV